MHVTLSPVKKDWDFWPATYRACISTYFRAEKFGRPGEVPADGAYMLAGLQRYWETWQANHSHRETPSSVLDAAAAHEIYFQHTRGRQFRRSAAALSACLVSMAIERPDRVLDRQIARAAKKKGAVQRAAGETA